MIKKHLLFVCLGNICRSPSAEAVMNSLLNEGGHREKIVCDSAGIIGNHSGAKADARMQKHARLRGYQLTSISRQVKPESDFDRFDMIIGMDDQNIKDLKSLARSAADLKKIYWMTDFSTQIKYKHIPDPYYGGNDGFELVLDLLEDACGGLIDHINQESKFEVGN